MTFATVMKRLIILIKSSRITQTTILIIPVISLLSSCSTKTNEVDQLNAKIKSLTSQIDSLENLQNQLEFGAVVLPYSNVVTVGELYKAKVLISCKTKHKPYKAVRRKFDSGEFTSTNDTIKVADDYGHPVFIELAERKGKQTWSTTVIAEIFGEEKTFIVEGEYLVE
jgi:hypothetical protein